MLYVTAEGRLQLHAQLFVFHEGPLFLHTLLFQLCLQTVDLGFKLGDVSLGLQRKYVLSFIFNLKLLEKYTGSKKEVMTKNK